MSSVSEMLGSQFKQLEDNYYQKRVEKKFTLDDTTIHSIMKRKIIPLNAGNVGEMAASEIIFTATVVVEPKVQKVIDAIENYFFTAGKACFGDFENTFNKVKINGVILIDKALLWV